MPMPGAMPTPPLPAAAAPVPPGLSAAPPNTGVTSPQGNPGNAASAMMKIRGIVKQLEEALPSIPVESPLHMKALAAVKSLLDAMPEESPDMAGSQQVSLMNTLRQNAQNSPAAMLAKLGAGGGAGGGAAPPTAAAA